MKISFPFLQKKEKRYVLVISGGGMRAFYGLGILKALEEAGYKEKIDAIYGVSAGGLLAAYWAAGYDADTILKQFLDSKFLSLPKNFKLLPKDSFLKNDLIKKQMQEELPKTFSGLKIPVFIGCTDTGKGDNILISRGDLTSALLGTIAIPGVFPAVKRGSMTLIDGGVTNNFPVEIAKESFPHHAVIGISLNKYRNHPEVTNLFDNLLVAFEIMLRKDIQTKGEMADIFFCRSLGVSVLEFSVPKLEKLFELGYQDGREKLAS